jgi:hypothetical protein
MNKKASMLLPEETIKIIVAALCIGFLAFILISIYLSVTGENNKKYAEASVKNVISPEITSINNGEPFKSQGIPVPNPNGWFIFSFVGTELKPDLCTGQNCLCICENVAVNPFNWRDKAQLMKCDDKGSCIVVSNLKKFDKILIGRGGTAILIKKVNNEIEITKK